MLNFRLFGYPVTVQWMFWLLCVLLGMNYLNNPDTRTGLGQFLIMAAIVFGSIIWHELGHAWARKKSGANYSEIMLHGFGGVCSGPGMFTRGQSIFIAAAGPAASLLLGGLTYLLTFTPGIGNFWVQHFVGNMLWVNVGWAILNLLPILPLDGGRIFEGIAGPNNFRVVVWTSIVLSAIIAVFGLLSMWLFMAVIFGFLAYSNWQLLQGQRARYY